MNPFFSKAVIIGTGNVATRLSLHLRDRGVEFLQVYGRTLEHAQTLAERLSSSENISKNHSSRQNLSESSTSHNLLPGSRATEAIADLEGLRPDADIYLMAVADDAIGQLARNLPFKPHRLLHTSGSTPMDVLKGCAEHYGILYPLQTISKDVEVDFSDVPFCVEADSPQETELLEVFAKTLSTSVFRMDSAQRSGLHIAAVFASNFTNHMLAIAKDILSEYDIPLTIMEPLVREICRKAFLSGDPASVQTGPARREDHGVMERHLAMLEEETTREIYRLVSQDIIRKKNLQTDNQGHHPQEQSTERRPKTSSPTK